MYLKQSLECGDVLGYSWKQGEEIVEDVLTKRIRLFTSDVILP